MHASYVFWPFNKAEAGLSVSTFTHEAHGKIQGFSFRCEFAFELDVRWEELWNVIRWVKGSCRSTVVFERWWFVGKCRWSWLPMFCSVHMRGSRRCSILWDGIRSVYFAGWVLHEAEYNGNMVKLINKNEASKVGRTLLVEGYLDFRIKLAGYGYSPYTFASPI